MVKVIRIKNKTLNYSIRIGNGLFKSFINDIKTQQSNIYILIDAKVYKIFSTYFNKLKNQNITLIKIHSSEKIKSIKTYWDITTRLLDKKINRADSVLPEPSKPAKPTMSPLLTSKLTFLTFLPYFNLFADKMLTPLLFTLLLCLFCV